MSDLPDPFLRFRPILKERVWGGRRLAEFDPSAPAGPIGEAWLLSDLPPTIDRGVSIIDGGRWHGRSLHQLLADHRVALLGACRTTADGRFPLLIKLLDARENLSVQVHPTPEYAAAHTGAAVKNEAWVILEAEPGAVLYTGLEEIDLATFRALAARGKLADALVTVPARVGDCHVLRSGTCHALGAGILVAEVQTPSDTTFRVDDWGRVGRDLHLAEAIECIFGADAPDDARPAVAPSAPSRPDRIPPIVADRLHTRTLARTSDFTIERIDAVPGAGDAGSGRSTGPSTLPVITNGQPAIWITVAGAVEIHHRDHDPAAVEPGRLVMVAASAQGTSLRLHDGAVVLRIDLPSPLDQMTAR